MSDAVLIRSDAVWSYVVGDGRADLLRLVDKVLYEKLAVEVAGARYTRLYKTGAWDGKRRFYAVRERKFLSGLLDRVVQILGKKGIPVKVDYLYRYKSFSTETIIEKLKQLNGIDWARFEQVQLPIVQEALSKGRCCVRLATGGGKTEVIAGLAKVLEEERVLVLTHRIELLDQISSKLKVRLGEKIGQISSGGVDVKGKRVVVGMVQSILSKMHQVADWLQNVDVLVIDECHHAGATTWVRIAQMCGKAWWRFGLSGTPVVEKEERDWLLVGVTGEVVEGKGLLELSELGYAVRPEVWVVFDSRLMFNNKLRKVRGGYAQCYKKVFADVEFFHVVEDVVRNLLEQFGGGILVFTERIDVCDNLFSLLSKKFDKVARSYGNSPKQLRLAVLDGFRKEKIKVLVTTTILDEGIDVEGVNAVVFACPGKSIVRIMQRIGRGVRPKEGKEKVVVCEFGISAPWFQEHLRFRLDMYRREGFDVKLAVLRDGMLTLQSSQSSQ